MDISLSWLRSLAPTIEGSPVEIAERLSLQAAAVDRIETIGDELGEVVVGKVISAGKHPNADRLTLCVVEAGGEPLEVVCGAPNVVEGGLYPFVAPGCTLPGGFMIEQRKIRGIVSNGMLCSEQELGLGRDSDGILQLEEGLEPGTPITAVLDLPATRFTLDLTPNRVDLACHVGVARELAPGGVEDVTLSPLGISWEPEWVSGEDSASGAGVSVVIEDLDRCHRYLAAVVRGVRVGSSPGWLQSQLRAAGSRSINNIVDATNYVLLESNQPLHAFDLSCIAGSEIRVREATAGESLTTLDGGEHKLASVVTVIADAEKPVALAGVMGGLDSEVTDETTDVLVECAWFDPGQTRGTAEHVGLSTDASYRFERGIDERGMESALQRCVELIVATAGGAPDPVAVRVGRGSEPLNVVRLRASRVRRLLGLRLSADQILGLLRPLGFRAEEPDGDSPEAEFEVEVPSWRNDVRREADLLEEVARRYGYDRFPDEIRSIRPSTVPDDPTWNRRELIATRLTAAGFLEARSLPMVGESMARDDHVALLHPLAATEAVLRTDLVPSLIARVEHNFARGHRDVRLFEIGTVFAKDVSAEPGRDQYVEEVRVGLVMTGARHRDHWSGASDDVDVWDLRGLIEQVVDLLPLVEVRAGWPQGEEPGFGFGRWLGTDRVAMFGSDESVGAGGSVQASSVDSPPWAGSVYAAEFRLSAVGVDGSRRYNPLPTYPATSRDLALTVPVGTSAAAVESVIRSTGPTELVSVGPFDVYQGKASEEGVRSIAWRLVFRATDRTLTDAEVESSVDSIVMKLREELDVRVRES
jgi:phenylalanyl-tRNA synthetase beta chain